jgi:HEPN domain-containing protein
MSVVESWVERAEYDLTTARAMLDTHRYLYVAFCCQQAVEKALKALIVKQTSAIPPRIHNLLRLADLAGLELTEERAEMFATLSDYYIESRYPTELALLEKRLNQALARNALEESEKVIQWLFSMLT